MKKLTIKTIAELAGVSVSTVSKIMNNYNDVSDETKKKSAGDYGSERLYAILQRAKFKQKQIESGGRYIRRRNEPRDEPSIFPPRPQHL